LNCGVYSLFPFPKEKEVINHYHSGIYRRPSKYNLNKQGKNFLVKKKYFIDRLIKLSQLLSRVGRILDVGAGNGLLLAEAKKRNWQVWGTELDPAAINYVKRKYDFKLLKGELSKLKIPKQYFDVVHLHHNLEHVYQPEALLNSIKTVFKPGGLLVIEVPQDLYPLSAVIKYYLSYKTRCRFLTNLFLKRKMISIKTTPSAHLFFFTPNSLKKLLIQSGFKIIQIKTPRRNHASDRVIYKHHYLANLIYFLESKLLLGPNIEVFAKIN